MTGGSRSDWREGRSGPSLAVLCLAWLVAAASARGETPPPAAPAGDPDDEPDQGLLEAEIVRLVDNIDRFFGDVNYDAVTNESFLRLAPGVRVREGPDAAFKLRLRANLQLPRTQRRIGLVLSGRGDDDDPLDDPRENEEDFAAGLRAALLDDPRTKVRLSVGSRFRPEPDPFVRLRLQRVQPFGSLAVRGSITGYWELEDGFGERTRVDLDYLIDPRALVRLRGQATYGESTTGVEFVTSLTYFFALRERSAWMVEARMEAATRPRSRINEWRLGGRYRWSLWRDWLFFEVEPRVRFPRSRDFDATAEGLFRVEIVFGSLARLGPLEAGPGEPDAR